MLTTRDLEVVRYLEDNLLLTADIASRLIYHTQNERSSLAIAQRRLATLYKEKQVKRIRNSITNSYVYYLGKTPTKVDHRLKISDFISRINTIGFGIDEIQLEYSELQDTYHIRPDIMMVVDYHKTKLCILVEVDLTKEFTNIEQYTRLAIDRKNAIPMNLPEAPLLLVAVTDKPIKRVKGQAKPITIKTDFSDIEKVKMPLIKL